MTSDRGSNPDDSEKQGLIYFGSDLPLDFGGAVSSELATADEAMFIVSFIKKTGVQIIENSLKEFTKTRRLKIITTTYLGITEQEAIDKIASLDNTEVRILFTRNNKWSHLHAKSYIFIRSKSNKPNSMLIGSSNISGPAFSSNIEWNVRLSSETNPIVLKQAINKFDELWDDRKLFRYDPDDERSIADLEEELNWARTQNKTYEIRTGTVYVDETDKPPLNFEIFPHQQKILDDLFNERQLGFFKNLVVAATGTGKTAVAAFDFKRFMSSNPNNNRLLFVAHRDEILRQSLETFRRVIGNSAFGYLVKSTKDFNDCDSPHIFTSIQLLNSKLIKKLDPNSFDYIIIDETHHACAKSYQSLFVHFKPKIILGLTATPERMDGLDIKQYFDNRIAHTLDLTTAINNSILTPFTYCTYTDSVDWSDVNINEIKTSELSKLVDSEEQIQMVISAVEDYTPNNLKDVRCLAFCADIKHAKTMCQAFNERWKGSSITITSESSLKERLEAPVRLANGSIHFIFTVDIYNEGVDIQKINTVLFLRPTESLTIYIQQLGRGLRKVNDPNFIKTNLTVIDFVGNYSKNYKVYLDKLAIMMGVPKHRVRGELLKDSPSLPKGCKFDFRFDSKDVILDYIEKQRISIQIQPMLIEFRRNHKNTGTLQDFLTEYDIDPKKMYSGGGNLTFYRYSKKNILDITTRSQFLSKIARIDSAAFANGISDVIINGVTSQESKVFANMLFFMMFPTSRHKGIVWKGNPDIKEFVDFLRSDNTLCKESLELIDFLKNNELLVPKTSEKEWSENILQIGCSYYSDQILAGLNKIDISNHYTLQNGVTTIDDCRMLLTVTLNHSKEHKIVFKDTAIDKYHFNWESQKGQTITGDPSQKLMDNNTEVLLFVRIESKDAYGTTAPYFFLGPVSCESYKGTKPFEIVWKTYTPIPDEILNFSNQNQVNQEM